MNPKVSLFIVALQVCVIGLLVSQAKPHWFRFNGKTPSRWKIGAMWGALAVACALGAVSQGQSPVDVPVDVTRTGTEEAVVPAEATTDMIDLAIPMPSPAVQGEDGVMDAARPAEDFAKPAVR